MIVGTGIDLCNLQRMESALMRTPRLVSRILDNNEIIESNFEDMTIQEKARLVAKRFAAKEALVKAMGGSRGLNFVDVGVSHTKEGAPYFRLSQKAEDVMQQGSSLHLSISDDGNYAVAMVVIEKSI